MGTVPTPATQTAGLVVPAATINGQGNLATYLAGRVESGGSRRPLCLLRQTVAQSIPSGSATAVLFDTEDVDYDNGHSTVTNTSRYTAGTAGWYAIRWVYATSGSATTLQAFPRINGSGLVASSSSTSGTALTVAAGTADVFLNVGDYVELMALQVSGGAVNTSVAAQNATGMRIQWISV